MFLAGYTNNLKFLSYGEEPALDIYFRELTKSEAPPPPPAEVQVPPVTD